jgi:hypothetical protein
MKFLSKYIIFFILFLLLIAVLYKINPKTLFISDTLIKAIQANSIVENDFRSEEILCKSLTELGSCKYSLPSFNFLNGKLLGPFPVYQSIVNAFIIYFFHPTLIQYFSVVLFVLLLLNLNKNWDINLYFIGIIVFCTPLFFHFIGFLDVGLAILLITLGISILNNEYNKRTISFLGFIFGVSVWFRPESIIFIFIFIVLIIISKYNIKNFSYYISFLFLSILSFFIINYYNYNNILGTRILANKSGFIEFNIQNKLIMIKSLLFTGEGRYGFFGYMPYILILSAIGIYYKNKIDLKYRVLMWSSLLSILFISFSSPNNSNIDWGTRYLSIVLIPLLIVFNKIKDIEYSKYLNILLIFVFMYSIKISHKYFTYHISMSKQVLKFDNIFESQNSDIWIFTNVSLLNFTNINYFDKKVLFFKENDNILELVEYLKNQKSTNTFSVFLVNSLISNTKNENSVPNPFASNTNLDNELVNTMNNIFYKIQTSEDYFIFSHTYKIK